MESLLFRGGRNAAMKEAGEEHTELGFSSSFSVVFKQTSRSEKLGFALQLICLHLPRLQLPWKDAGL